MIQIVDKRNCVGCGNCVQVCPVSCISFERDSEGFMYPHADGLACVECGTCHRVCPVEEPEIEADENYELRSYGAINKNLNVRMQSSSGGIFSLIAESILNNQGHVYGASQQMFAHVAHVSISHVDDMPELRRSKYVQSDLVGVFPKIKQDIENGIHVLFSGTPCQVKALNVFLSQRPENLLTVEVVCHGVPSPMIFEKYLQETGATSMVFRNKDRSWSDYDVEVHYSSGKVRKERASQNLYMRGFLQNWFLRPSCSQCPAKSFSSGADITLGDFWGGQSLVPHLFDDKGTSVVFLHTHKAEAIWREVSAAVDSCEVPPVEAVAGNPCVNQSVSFPTDRELFFRDAERQPLLKVLRNFVGEKKSFGGIIKNGFWILWNKASNIIYANRS